MSADGYLLGVRRCRSEGASLLYEEPLKVI